MSNAEWMLEMFADTGSFDADISGWDLQRASVVWGMFTRAMAFSHDLSSWRIGPNVTSLNSFFRGTPSIQALDLSGWDVSNIDDFSYMFDGSGVTTANLATWDVSGASNFTSMFRESAFNEDLCQWGALLDADAVVADMFVDSGCEDTVDPVLELWPFSSVCTPCDYITLSPTTTLSPSISGPPSMVPTRSSAPVAVASSSPSGAPSLSPKPTSSFRCFNSTEELQNAVDAYVEDNSPDSDTALTYGWPIGNWCVDKVTSFVDVFSGIRNRALRDFNEPVGNWSTSQVTDMRSTFLFAFSFNQPLDWDVSNVVYFHRMFDFARSFEQDLGSWDVSRAKFMRSMFNQARVFTGRGLERWNTSACTEMHRMFYNSRIDADLSSWDVSNVELFSRMFSDTSFNGDISRWSTSSAVSLWETFARNTAFNQNITGWDTSKVFFLEGVFRGASSFNQNIASWNITQKVFDMTRVFEGASAFNQDISAWDVSNVTRFTNTFRFATSFNQDLSNWKVSRGIEFTRMFEGAASFNRSLCSWGDDIQPEAITERMFVDSACQSTAGPDLGTICGVCEPPPDP